MHHDPSRGKIFELHVIVALTIISLVDSAPWLCHSRVTYRLLAPRAVCSTPSAAGWRSRRCGCARGGSGPAGGPLATESRLALHPLFWRRASHGTARCRRSARSRLGFAETVSITPRQQAGIPGHGCSARRRTARYQPHGFNNAVPLLGDPAGGRASGTDRRHHSAPQGLDRPDRDYAQTRSCALRYSRQHLSPNPPPARAPGRRRADLAARRGARSARDAGRRVSQVARSEPA